MGDIVPLFRRSGSSRADTPSAAEWYERGCAIEARSRVAGRSASLGTAMRAYQRAVARDPSHAAALSNLGRLLHAAGDITAAEEHYRRAVKAAPEEPIYWFNLGVALQDRDKTLAAANAYRTALTLDPECRDAHFNLAGLLDRRGDRRGALQHLAAYRRLAHG
ncbi:MAG: tetratricopeptide repeat protein [Proteobacteria bacterium]|nr:tetratricopeptide repeat protein [Pseudomonadota bacterium]